MIQNPKSNNRLSFTDLLVSQQIKAIEIGESPLEELEIQPQGTDDIQELHFILGKILTYPSTELAKLHKHSNKLGSNDLKDDHQNNFSFAEMKEIDREAQFCPCCGFIKQEDNLKLCTKFDRVQNLGISTYFYFLTLRNLMALLLIMILVYSIYALVTNIIASDRYDSDDKLQTLKSNLSVQMLALGSKILDKSNKDENKTLYLIQCWIGVGLVLIFAFIFVVIKSKQKQIELEINRQTKSASDYSIIMQNVPTSFTSEQMQQQLNRYHSQIEGVPTYIMRHIEIAKYNVAKPFYLDETRFESQEIQELNERYNNMIEMFIEWIEERRGGDDFSVPKEKRKQHYKEFQVLKKQRLEAYKKVTDQILSEFNDEDQEPTTTVFITFKSSYSKKLLIDENHSDLPSKIRYWLSCCQGKNKFYIQDENGNIIHKVKIYEAPQPEDIIWTNLGQKDSDVVKRKIITFLITILLLGISFGAVFGLSFVQNQNKDNTYISVLISLVISIVNVIITQVLRRLTLYERDYTSTYHQTSLGIKAVLALLVNSILIPILANQIIKQQNIYGTNGLAYDVFLLGITNSFLQPAMKVFDLYFYFTRIMAWWNNRPSTKLYLNQPELNTVNEYMEFQIGYEYIYFVNLFLFTCFFVSLQPIISIFALLGMFCMFWAQKYSVYERVKRPIPGTVTINTAMYQLIYLGPLFFSLGNFTWSHFLNEEEHSYEADPERLIPNIIAVGLSAVIFLLPYRLIFEFVFSDEIELEMEYENNKIYLPSEYDRLNPSTSEKAIKAHMDYIENYKNSLENKSEEEKKKIQQIFMKQMQRGHRNPNALAPLFGGGSNRMIQNIFAPQQNSVNGLLIGQALFQQNNNPLPLLVQNWHGPNQGPAQNSNAIHNNQNPILKMTESDHMMLEKDKPNGTFGNQNQGHEVPIPPPNMFNNTNPFNQLFPSGNQPVSQNMGNPYYNPYYNPYSQNPFGQLNEHQGP